MKALLGFLLIHTLSLRCHQGGEIRCGREYGVEGGKHVLEGTLGYVFVVVLVAVEGEVPAVAEAVKSAEEIVLLESFEPRLLVS